VVTQHQELQAALNIKRGVVYVQDVVSLGHSAQVRLVQMLWQQEERAKWVFGLAKAPEALVESGALRPDIAFKLSAAVVDLSDPKARAGLKVAPSKPKPAPTKRR
jgi:hypothetical protein